MSLLKRIEMERDRVAALTHPCVTVRSAYAFGQWPPKLTVNVNVQITARSVTNDPAVRVP